MSQLHDRMALILIVICRLIEGRDVALCKAGLSQILPSVNVNVEMDLIVIMARDTAVAVAWMSGTRFSPGERLL
jgi:hypothetical protein